MFRACMTGNNSTGTLISIWNPTSGVYWTSTVEISINKVRLPSEHSISLKLNGYLRRCKWNWLFCLVELSCVLLFFLHGLILLSPDSNMNSACWICSVVYQRIQMANNNSHQRTEHTAWLSDEFSSREPTWSVPAFTSSFILMNKQKQRAAFRHLSVYLDTSIEYVWIGCSSVFLEFAPQA